MLTNLLLTGCFIITLGYGGVEAASINETMATGHEILKRSVTVPQQPCTSTNERAASSDPNQHDLVWICQSGSWLPYKITPSTGTTKDLAGKSCKHIRDKLASNCFKSPQSGAYWIDYTDTCSNETTAMKVLCDMELDGGGWTMVWKHSYMEVPLPLIGDMTYFSDFYKPCTDLEAGWCNVPRKAQLVPTEMMIAAYHNKRVVYAYTRGSLTGTYCPIGQVVFYWSHTKLLTFAVPVMVFNQHLFPL